MLDYLTTTDQRAATEAALTTNRRIRLSAEGPALGAILDAWPTVSAAIDAESAARKAISKSWNRCQIIHEMWTMAFQIAAHL